MLKTWVFFIKIVNFEKSISLKVPSLTKPSDYDDGNIYDDLDSGSEIDIGARVASPETTDMLRKSQIMDLKKQ